MKTPDEIKKGLRLCSTWETNCEECPYNVGGKIFACGCKLKGDALAYIEQIEERIALMLIQMRGDCGCCKHRNERPSEGGPCNKCAEKDGHPLWEYEGLPEVPKKGASA